MNTRIVPITPEARGRARRRMLTDNSRVQLVVTRPRLIAITPESRTKAHRRAWADQSKVTVRL